jgi:hypothetical protein
MVPPPIGQVRRVRNLTSFGYFAPTDSLAHPLRSPSPAPILEYGDAEDENG